MIRNQNGRLNHRLRVYQLGTGTDEAIRPKPKTARRYTHGNTKLINSSANGQALIRLTFTTTATLKVPLSISPKKTGLRSLRLKPFYGAIKKPN